MKYEDRKKYFEPLYKSLKNQNIFNTNKPTINNATDNDEKQKKEFNERKN